MPTLVLFTRDDCVTRVKVAYSHGTIEYLPDLKNPGEVVASANKEKKKRTRDLSDTEKEDARRTAANLIFP